MGKTQEDAGVLKVGGDELTPGARHRFIEDVMDILRNGSSSLLSVPCGPEIAPIPAPMIPNLHDREMFADWQDNCIGNYYNIASMLNIKGMTPFLPVLFDPLHIAAELEFKLPSLTLPEFLGLIFNLPALMLKLEIQAPDIQLELPRILKLLPSPFPPELPIPDLEFKYDLNLIPHLLKFQLDPTIQIPILFFELLAKFPKLIVQLLIFDLSFMCEMIWDKLSFSNGPNPFLLVATTMVLVRKTVECLTINLVGVTVGSSSGGVVGAVGREFGYVPPELLTDPATETREKIVKFAKSMSGMSYGNKDTREKYTMGVLPCMICKNDGSIEKYGNRAEVDPTTPGKPLSKALVYAKTMSSCGIFIRGALIAAGATGDRYFDQQYDVKQGDAISGLLRIARNRGALLFDGTKKDKVIPPMKKGDFIIIGRQDGKAPYPLHCEMFLDDYPGGTENFVLGIGGGFPDYKNKKSDGVYYGTMIHETRYKFEIRSEGGYWQHPFAGPVSGVVDPTDVIGTSATYLRPVLAIIDAEKIVNGNG